MPQNCADNIEEIHNYYITFTTRLAILIIIIYNNFSKKYGGTVKPKSKKKMLGAAIIGAASSLIGAGIQAANQRKLYEQQQADQRKLQNIQNTNAMINNLNQQANNNMDWAYDKFKPIFKLGGTQSKFKNRF